MSTRLTIAEPGSDFTTAKVAAASSMIFKNTPSRPVRISVFNAQAAATTTVTFVRKGKFANGATMSPNRVETAIPAVSNHDYIDFPANEFNDENGDVEIQIGTLTTVTVLAQYR